MWSSFVFDRRRVLGTSFAAVVLFCGAVSALTSSAHARERSFVVFAAASLKESLDAQVKAFESAQPDVKIRVSYAGSQALAKQIEAGAPAALFIAADWESMAALQAANRFEGAPQVLLRNSLVIVQSPMGGAGRIDLSVSDGRARLQRVLDDRVISKANARLAMADPASVPAGRYGKAALEAVERWSALESKLARTDNVRAALAFVTRGEAPLGIVYRTDAMAEPRVNVLAEFPASYHPPIEYPMALVSRHANDDARVFARFLQSDAAMPRWREFGFLTK